MQAWEAIQKTLDYLEERIEEEHQIEDLADIAALSLFYYQRLFSRLVKKPVREYIKLRRLARSREMLRDKENRILDIAIKYGFGGRETFTRAFKQTYGLTPAQYRDKPLSLNDFDKPNLLLNYTMIDEGVPLISEGLVLEYNFRTLNDPVTFLGVKDIWRFKPGKMLGERPGIDEPGEIWNKFFSIRKNIPRLPGGRIMGVSYHGGAPAGYSSYFVGAEAEPGTADLRFASWCLPAREYLVCGFEAENPAMLRASLGKMMKYTRLWLKKHGLRAVEFFPEIYYPDSKITYMEMWLPFIYRDCGSGPQ
ncbi:MAG: AraC family transcriptional regulator [Lachnospiraceae bacterium]|nr:AraC family transcriptional regulator [Lachnospiraceae bacterium]